MFIKTGTKACIKGCDCTCRLRSLRGGPVLWARGRGTDPHSPTHNIAHRRALLRSHRGLRRIQASTQSGKRNKSFIVELESETVKIWGSE